MASNGDSFDILTAHDGADAGSAGVSAPLAGHTGEADEILPGDADGGYSDVVISDQVADASFGFQIALSLQLRAGLYGNAVVVDEEIAQLRRFADDGEAVVSGLA